MQTTKCAEACFATQTSRRWRRTGARHSTRFWYRQCCEAEVSTVNHGCSTAGRVTRACNLHNNVEPCQILSAYTYCLHPSKASLTSVLP